MAEVAYQSLENPPNPAPSPEIFSDDMENSTAKRRKIDTIASTSQCEIMEPEPEGLPSDDNAPPVASILYIPGTALPKLGKYVNHVIEVRIAAKHLTTRNKEVSTRQIWGTDIYTDDSDVVAICQHTGKVLLRPTISIKSPGISAFFRVLPPQSDFIGQFRYKLQSRNWIPRYHKTCLQMLKTAPIIHADKLDPRSPGNQLKVPKSVAGAGPTRRPYAKRRFAPDITIMFNSWNEPCLKYCLGLVSDRGMSPDRWTSTRLRREVLYLNADGVQYELMHDGDDGHHDLYRWSRCVKYLESSNRRVPIPDECAEVVQRDIDWEEIEWGLDSVNIRRNKYIVKTIQFLPMTAQN